MNDKGEKIKKGQTLAIKQAIKRNKKRFPFCRGLTLSRIMSQNSQTHFGTLCIKGLISKFNQNSFRFIENTQIFNMKFIF